MTTAPPSRRRWFQFSLRTLLLLVTIVGAGFGWVGFKMRQATQQRHAVEAIVALGGGVCYDYQYSAGILNVTGKPSAPAWLRNLLGDDFFSDATYVQWTGPQVTDKALVPLRWLPKLERLDLSRGNITDAGLANLQALSQLQALDLYGTSVTDDGLSRLLTLKKLAELDLSSTGVTDAGLVHLKEFSQLTNLYLDGTQVTDIGRKELQQSRPALEMYRWRF